MGEGILSVLELAALAHPNNLTLNDLHDIKGHERSSAQTMENTWPMIGVCFRSRKYVLSDGLL